MLRIVSRRIKSVWRSLAQYIKSGEMANESPTIGISKNNSNIERERAIEEKNKNRRLPHLRVCITSECNLNCVFCRPGGESAREWRDARMTVNEISSYIGIAAALGVCSLKYSGGEPLLYKDKHGFDIVDLIDQTSSIEGITDIQLVTNGVLLKEFAPRLADVKLSLLTVSLETLDPDKFNILTREEGLLSQVVEGIRTASDLRIPLRINTIVMRSNRDELWKLIRFAEEVNAEIKFLDLLDFQTPEGPNFSWKNEYVCNYRIRKELASKAIFSTIELPAGDVGTPMYRYFLRNGVEVLVKDACVGTHYGDICRNCYYYPCQDGLYCLRLTSYRRLKRCWPSDEDNIPIKKGESMDSIRNKFEQALLTFENSRFERKWTPEGIKRTPFLGDY